VTADRFAAAIAAIDAANADDPETLVVRGERRPKEQAHAELMTEWVTTLEPSATDAQLLAARAHHLRRWTIPRASYPDGRAGYLRWRTALKRQHADDVATILREAGYDDATIEHVQRIIRKEGLGNDPAVQVHEDALCLTFLETQLDDLAARLGDDHTVEVIVKTAAKMSDDGLERAAALPLSEHGGALLARALQPS
jgi:hypothetical protein